MNAPASQYLATRDSDPPRVVPPARDTIFAASARRFETLAERHALGDWLRFLGRLAQAQHEALLSFPAEGPVLHAGLIARARHHGMPPLPAHAWPRDASWRVVLAGLVDAALIHAPAPGRAALQGLRRAPAARLEAAADRVLRMDTGGGEAATMPIVAAALQVYWTHMAATLGTAGIVPLDVPGVCPCCGFLPVASIVRSRGDSTGLRYLRCALCNTEWNFVRIKCVACDGNDKVAYRQIRPAAGAAVKGMETVRAETCENCRSYLKIVYQEQEADVDPVADDLATLALDMLMDEAGYARAGPNLLLSIGGG